MDQRHGCVLTLYSGVLGVSSPWRWAPIQEQMGLISLGLGGLLTGYLFHLIGAQGVRGCCGAE